MTIGHPKIEERYRIDSGGKLPKFGTVDYSMITQNGDGYAYLPSGNHLMACKGTSHECVGTDLKGGGAKNSAYQPAKWIKADSGDIVFEAPQGTIYLNAKNIVLVSNAADPDGNIFLSSCNDIYIKSTDSVTVTGTNVTVNGSKTATLVGKSTTNIAANFIAIADTTDVVSSITSLDSRVLDLLKLLETI